MSRQLVHVENRQTVGREYPGCGREREVREMFVINLVELVALHRLQQVRKFDVTTPLGLSNSLDAFDKVVHVRHLGQDVVADDQIGGLALATIFRAVAFAPKNSTRVGMPLCTATAATLAAGSTPTGMPLATKCWRR